MGIFLLQPNIHEAAEFENFIGVQKRVNSNPNAVNSRNHKGWTPLHPAAWKNRTTQIVEFLLAHGADVDARNEFRWTPLHAAAHSNPNLEIHECLLKNGADFNAKTNSLQTPLHLAAMKNRNPDVIRLLINAGADLNAKDKYGRKPLDYASTYQKQNILLQVTTTEVGEPTTTQVNETQTEILLAKIRKLWYELLQLNWRDHNSFRSITLSSQKTLIAIFFGLILLIGIMVLGLNMVKGLEEIKRDREAVEQKNIEPQIGLKFVTLRSKEPL